MVTGTAEDVSDSSRCKRIKDGLAAMGEAGWGGAGRSGVVSNSVRYGFASRPISPAGYSIVVLADNVSGDYDVNLVDLRAIVEPAIGRDPSLLVKVQPLGGDERCDLVDFDISIQVLEDGAVEIGQHHTLGVELPNCHPR